MVNYTIPRTLPADKKKMQRAHNLLNTAVQRGDIARPDSCSECGDKRKVVAHHWNYDLPYDVTWLCHWCHKHLHYLESEGKR